jgi:hypothetical protein
MKIARHVVQWSPEMDAALIQLRGKLHAEEVARRVGVSAQTMYARLRQLQQPIRPCARDRARDDAR